MLAVDGYRYGGKDFGRGELAREIARRAAVRSRRWSSSATATGAVGSRGSSATGQRLEFEQVAVRAPAMGALQLRHDRAAKADRAQPGRDSAGAAEDIHLHLDAQPGDRIFWFSTTGWMMWNLLVGVLLTDAPIVLFDGNPGYPTMERLWDLAERPG